MLRPLTMLVLLFAFAGSTAVHGRPYDGLGPGESTIGIGGDYPSLYAACEAMSNDALSGGDWTFLILNDLEEPNNVALTQDQTNGHTITFRPAAGTEPTVTFTTTTANAYGLVGHFNIGVRLDELTPEGYHKLVPTGNIVIDGSNDPTTSARSMTWRNTGRHSGSSSVIAVHGNSNSVAIRNCKIEFEGPSSSSLYDYAAVEFSSYTFPSEGGIVDAVPDFGSVENCLIDLRTAYRFGTGISLNNRTVGPRSHVFPPAKGMVAAGNDILSGAQGILVRNCGDVLIAGNTISTNARLRSSPWAIRCIAAATEDNTGELKLDSNTIVCTGTELSHWRAMFLESRGTTTTLTVTNNMIKSLCDSDFTIISGVSGVIDESSTLTIAHNSMNFHTTASNSEAGRYAAVHLYENAPTYSYVGATFVRNNIFRMSVDNGVVFSVAEGPGFFESEDNIIHTTSTAHVGWFKGGAPLSTLEDWQTSTGQDMSSVVMDPFEPAAPGMGTWSGPADDPNQDLHFTSFPGDIYLVPPMPEITADADGEPRGNSATLAGADEVPKVTAVESWQLY